MRYIIAPLDLTTEQREVYFLLYSKMDFDTNLVKYTLEQLNTDSNVKLELTKKKVSYIIKKFIDDGLLTIIKKGSKGNPTIYKIINMKELNLGTQREVKSNTKETQREVKSNLKCSNSNGLNGIKEHKGNLKETQRELKGNTKVTPIIDKEIEIDKDKEKKKEYEQSFINIRKAYPGKKTLKDAKLKLPKLIKKYGEEELLKIVNRYKKSVEARRENGFKNLQYQNEGTFWNGGYMDYLEENYEEVKNGKNKQNDSTSKNTDRKDTTFKGECEGDRLQRLALEKYDKGEIKDVGELPF